MAELRPVAPPERVAALDVIRGWALFGVMVANVHEVISGRRYGPQPADTATLDIIATRFIEIVISGKSITLLTFLFGLGFALQLLRAGERGEDVRGLYVRRLAVLFVIGACHATFLWWGDVTWTYAAMGFALLAFRRAGERALLAWAIVLLMQRPAARRTLLVLPPVGRMPLTTYLCQSVATTFVFYGWGLGLTGKIGSAGSLAITFVIFALQIVVSHLWLRRFRFGPAEWLWRTLVYRRLQPMRA